MNLPPRNSPGATELKPAPMPLDGMVVGAILLGLACLFAPTIVDLATKIWGSDEQGHGPIILAVFLWLIYGKRAQDFGSEPRPQRVPGVIIFGFVWCVSGVGRSQYVPRFEEV